MLLLLVDHIKQRFLERVTLFFVEITVHLQVELIHCAADRRHLIETVELLVLRHAKLHLEELGGCRMLGIFVRAFAFKGRLRLSHQIITIRLLLGDQLLNARLNFTEWQRIIILHRAGNDQRRARLIDQDRVNLVNDTEEVVALHLVFLATGHTIVAQVVEAKLRSGAVRDVTLILLATNLWRLAILDTANGETEHAEQVAHPLGVTTREVVIDGDQLAVVAGKRIQVERAS